jgi:hypothetical protein
MGPPCGVIEVNQDAAIDKSRKMISVGVIVRDHEGNVLATMCSPKPYIIDQTIEETYAA